MSEYHTLTSQRNLITFTNFQNINLTICNIYLADVLETFLKNFSSFLDTYLTNYNINFTIRSNKFNWSCLITTTARKKTQTKSIDELEKLLETISEKYTKLPCCYLAINKKIIINNKFLDVFGITYNPLSFRQPDDSIRNYIITYFNQVLSSRTWKYSCFIGGECTLYGKLTDKLTIKYFYTDFESIYNDLLDNHTEYSETIKLINYDEYKFPWLDIFPNDGRYDNTDNTILIANTSFHGLGIHLANEITNSLCYEIYIVSCNWKSFLADFQTLQTKYFISNLYELVTCTNIYIIKLSRNV